jgi:sulfur relay protein TusB/DsrH
MHMTVIVKSSPDTPEGKRGLQTARDLGADIVLLQNGVYFVLSQSASIPDTQVYAIEEDCLMRGIVAHPESRVRMIDYAELVDILRQSDHVVGML